MNNTTAILKETFTNLEGHIFIFLSMTVTPLEKFMRNTTICQICAYIFIIYVLTTFTIVREMHYTSPYACGYLMCHITKSKGALFHHELCDF